MKTISEMNQDEKTELLKAIEENGHEIALVFFSGVQYYTGQFFQIKEITAAAHEKVSLSLLKSLLISTKERCVQV